MRIRRSPVDAVSSLCAVVRFVIKHPPSVTFTHTYTRLTSRFSAPLMSHFFGCAGTDRKRRTGVRHAGVGVGWASDEPATPLLGQEARQRGKDQTKPPCLLTRQLKGYAYCFCFILIDLHINGLVPIRKRVDSVCSVSMQLQTNSKAWPNNFFATCSAMLQLLPL